ncbi:hypothetical protein WMY93_031679 [Mugilogobius chulae]|uniref:Uncharacterized protein n=1 Tax=Mugilogobius chulae TaxID=88201 RepID=A0AAW0MKP3_9GOBI
MTFSSRTYVLLMFSSSGRYMTFVLNPLHIPSITRLGRQLDFHEFSNTVAPYMFGYTPLHPERVQDLREKVHVLFKLLQGHHLTPLSGEHDEEPAAGVQRGPPGACRFRVENGAAVRLLPQRLVRSHLHDALRPLGVSTPTPEHPKDQENFVIFDRMIPMLIAQVPLWLLGRTKHVRQKLIDVFSSSVLSEWSDSSEFIQRRRQLFDQYNELSGQDKAGTL